MNTLLEAIQKHPEAFISTLEARAMTTPSQQNKDNHTCLSVFIKYDNWDSVQQILLDYDYRKPLEGVVYCLSRYSGIDNSVWNKIVNIYEEGKLV